MFASNKGVCMRVCVGVDNCGVRWGGGGRCELPV